jgi:hypothetical protein
LAIYHLHVSIVSRSKGRSSVAAAAYRSAEKLKSEKDGITHDYTPQKSDLLAAAAYRSGGKLENEQEGIIHDFTRKRGVIHSEIILPDNAPRDFADRATLWNAVEKTERRHDAQTARDIDVALPVEFSREEQLEIMRDYIRENFVKRGMCADFAIHDKGDGNPHAHILLTTRHVTEKGFGNKNRDWNDRKCLLEWREKWADVCNERLIKKELSERIDHRTLKAQGIDREPTIHIGVSAKNMERAGRDSYKVKEHREIAARNAEISPKATAVLMHELKQGVFNLETEISALTQETSQARQEANVARVQAEKIAERAEQINTLTEGLTTLRAERREMGVFANKKPIDEQIKRLEHSREQAIKYFERTYGIDHREAGGEVSRRESIAQSKGHLEEKLREKLSPLTEEQGIFLLKYQRQKLLAEISPKAQEIRDELARLDKESRQNQKSARENIARAQIERNLDLVTENNFYTIVKDLRPEQAKALTERREREKEWERQKAREIYRRR